MLKCKHCGMILDFGAKECQIRSATDLSPAVGCGSRDLVPASYEDLVANGCDPWYAAEITGDVDAARALMKDVVIIVVNPEVRDI